MCVCQRCHRQCVLIFKVSWWKTILKKSLETITESMHARLMNKAVNILNSVPKQCVRNVYIKYCRTLTVKFIGKWINIFCHAAISVYEYNMLHYVFLLKLSYSFLEHFVCVCVGCFENGEHTVLLYVYNKFNINMSD